MKPSLFDWWFEFELSGLSYIAFFSLDLWKPGYDTYLGPFLISTKVAENGVVYAADFILNCYFCLNAFKLCAARDDN